MSLITYGLSFLRVLITNMFLILALRPFYSAGDFNSFPESFKPPFLTPKLRTISKLSASNVNHYMGLKAIISMATGVYYLAAPCPHRGRIRRNLGTAGIFS